MAERFVSAAKPELSVVRVEAAEEGGPGSSWTTDSTRVVLAVMDCQYAFLDGQAVFCDDRGRS